MKYSLPEYSPFNNPNDQEPNFKGSMKAASRKGIPNYTTVLPSNSTGYYKPLVNPYYSDLTGSTIQPFPSYPNIQSQPRTTTQNMPDVMTPGTSTPPIPGTPTPAMPATPGIPTQPGTSAPTTPTTPRTTTPRTTTPAQPGTSVPSTPTTPRTTTPTIPTTPSMPRTTIPVQPGTSAPTSPTQPRTTMPAAPTTPSMPRTTVPAQPGTSAPTLPTQPRTTIPAAPTTPSMPGTTMPAQPGTSAPTLPTQPRTTMPATPTTPSMPRTTTPATPFMPATPGTSAPTSPTQPGSATPFMPTQPGSTPSMPTIPGTAIPNMSFQSRANSPAYFQESINHYADSNKSDYDYTALPTYGNNGIYISDLNSYRVPMGVPMMPLYGYDNCEDADKDWDYMKQMYPINAKKLLGEIEDECDKLEYDGSCMFDEYPDKVYVGRIVDRIYAKYNYMEDDTVSQESISPSTLSYNNKEKSVKSNQYDLDRDYRQDGRDRRDRRDRRQNWLRDLIEVLLFNEMLNRRRRYRGRRRWF